MNQWSVTKRITVVFALVLSLSLCLAGASALIGFQVANGFAEYRAAARQSRMIADQAIELADIRRQVALSRLEEEGSAERDAAQALRRLAFSHRLASAMFAADPDAGGALNRIGGALRVYETALTKRAALHAERAALNPLLRGDAARIAELTERKQRLEAKTLWRVGEAAMDSYRALLGRLIEKQNRVGPRVTVLAERTPVAVAVATLILGLLGGALAALVGRRIARDITGMAGAMKRLADGDLDTPVETRRGAELGLMANALRVFKENALEARRLAAEREETKAREVALTIARDRAEAEIRAMEAANAHIEHASLHDPLTGLANRRHIERLLQRCVEEGRGVSLLQVDLDGFKHVNDGHSHRAGDHVLRRVASLIQDALDDGEHAARMGGDEFLVLAAYDPTYERPKQLADLLIERISQPIAYKGAVCRVGVSVGVSAAPAHTLEIDEILAEADAALFQAKHQGGGRRQVFDDALKQKLERERRDEAELKAAVRSDAMEPYLHPQVCARTLEIIGFEALARWPHPERGVLTPGQFLDTADRLELTPEIDRAMLRRALDGVRRLNAEQGRAFHASVNFSDGLLRDPALPAEMAALGDLRLLRVEVLESVFFDEDDGVLSENIDAMKALGVEVELDDFGSGHASVIGLTRLKPSRLKIDRRLVSPAVRDPKARRLVSSIVEMGKTLEIGCVAEGVETWEHLEAMRNLGVDLMQGFAVARPMPLAEVPRFLAEWSERVRLPTAEAG